MPCLILTGHPCVGKTTFAHALAECAVQHASGIITSTVVIEETSRRWNVATMLPERIQKYGGKQLSIHHDLSNIKRTEFRPTVQTYKDMHQGYVLKDRTRLSMSNSSGR
eukprot:scaffold355797_cov71-Attheya_sp.AAC.1